MALLLLFKAHIQLFRLSKTMKMLALEKPTIRHSKFVAVNMCY
jgi:hypothetical protein